MQMSFADVTYASSGKSQAFQASSSLEGIPIDRGKYREKTPGKLLPDVQRILSAEAPSGSGSKAIDVWLGKSCWSASLENGWKWNIDGLLMIYPSILVILVGFASSGRMHTVGAPGALNLVLQVWPELGSGTQRKKSCCGRWLKWFELAIWYIFHHFSKSHSMDHAGNAFLCFFFWCLTHGGYGGDVLQHCAALLAPRVNWVNHPIAGPLDPTFQVMLRRSSTLGRWREPSRLREDRDQKWISRFNH